MKSDDQSLTLWFDGDKSNGEPSQPNPSPNGQPGSDQPFDGDTHERGNEPPHRENR